MNLSVDGPDRIRRIVARQLDLAEYEVRLESKLKDLGADCLDKIEICLSIEDREEEGGFGVNIPDGEEQGFETVADLFNYIKAHSP